MVSEKDVKSPEFLDETNEKIEGIFRCNHVEMTQNVNDVHNVWKVILFQ